MSDNESIDLSKKPNRGPRVDKSQLMGAVAKLPEVLGQMGFTELREGQDLPIYNIMAGRDTICILPTGTGKTAVFVIPTLCLEWRTIVFSPLVALMRDQVKSLWAKNIAAGQISGLQSPAENAAVLGDWLEGNLKFLYVAPERLSNEMFKTAMKHVPPDMVVLDEAHTLSQWSDNFRPDYVKVGGFIEEYDPKVVATFTATAPLEVEDDIRRVLGIKHANRCKFYPRRENLELRSADLSGNAEIGNFLRRRPGSAIVYCSTIKNVEDLYADLTDYMDEEITYYHGKMSPDQKRINQDRFMNDKARIVVATNAFGMGIDKPDIRTVIHRDLPGSVEALAQEVGRAGRDGKPSVCMSYRHQKAIDTQHFFIESGNPAKSDIQAVYDTLKMSEDSNGEVYMKMNEIAQAAGVRDIFVMSCLSVLVGAGCIKRVTNTNKTFTLKLNEPEDGDTRMKNYFEVFKEGGVTQEGGDGSMEISLDWLLERLGLTQGTVMKYIKQWAQDEYLFYDPPYNGKITHITGPLDLIDFDRLADKSKRDWENFEKLLAYFDTPDEDKHEFLENYFGKD